MKEEVTAGHSDISPAVSCMTVSTIVCTEPFSGVAMLQLVPHSNCTRLSSMWSSLASIFSICLARLSGIEESLSHLFIDRHNTFFHCIGGRGFKSQLGHAGVLLIGMSSTLSGSSTSISSTSSVTSFPSSTSMSLSSRLISCRYLHLFGFTDCCLLQVLNFLSVFYTIVFYFFYYFAVWRGIFFRHFLNYQWLTVLF